MKIVNLEDFKNVPSEDEETNAGRGEKPLVADCGATGDGCEISMNLEKFFGEGEDS
jgi:hypothetical protein